MSSQISNPNTEAAILARLIQIGQDELPPGAADTCYPFASPTAIRHG
jgi:hypothetical protein